MSQGVCKSEITYVDCIKSLILHKKLLVNEPPNKATWTFVNFALINYICSAYKILVHLEARFWEWDK